MKYRGPMDKYTAWCREMFDSLNDGGKWCVPRSGLIFQRRGADKLVLVEVMKHDPAMPVTADELRAMQESDYESSKEEFALAGIDIEREQ